MTHQWYSKKWIKWACACAAYMVIVLLAGQQSWAFHDAKTDRIYDVNNTLDETRINNMSPAEQRLLMEAQHPGINKWKQWKILQRHPDTGAIITCRRYARSHCRTFASYDDYQRFRIWQWEGKDRRRYGYFDSRYVNAVNGGNQWTWTEQSAPPPQTSQIEPPQYQSPPQYEADPQVTTSRGPVNGSNQWTWDE